MAFIRIKTIKGITYLYLVKSVWKKKGARQKVLKYYGRIDKGIINRQAVIDRDKCCQICGSVVNLTVDHIISLALGGNNTYENVWVLCENCNLKKSNMKYEDGKFVEATENEKLLNQLQLVIKAYTNIYKKENPDCSDEAARRSVLRRKKVIELAKRVGAKIYI